MDQLISEYQFQLSSASRRSSFRGRERAIVNQTNIGTVSTLEPLGKLLRRGGMHMGFSERIDYTTLNRTSVKNGVPIDLFHFFCPVSTLFFSFFPFSFFRRWCAKELASEKRCPYAMTKAEVNALQPCSGIGFVFQISPRINRRNSTPLTSRAHPEDILFIL